MLFPDFSRSSRGVAWQMATQPLRVWMYLQSLRSAQERAAAAEQYRQQMLGLSKQRLEESQKRTTAEQSWREKQLRERQREAAQTLGERRREFGLNYELRKLALALRKAQREGATTRSPFFSQMLRIYNTFPTSTVLETDDKGTPTGNVLTVKVDPITRKPLTFQQFIETYGAKYKSLLTGELPSTVRSGATPSALSPAPRPAVSHATSIPKTVDVGGLGVGTFVETTSDGRPVYQFPSGKKLALKPEALKKLNAKP
jgi:hypothetical protein